LSVLIVGFAGLTASVEIASAQTIIRAVYRVSMTDPANGNVLCKAIHALDEDLAFQAAKQLIVRDRSSTRPDGSFQITDVLAILN